MSDMPTVIELLTRAKFGTTERLAVKTGLSPTTLRKIGRGGEVVPRVREVVERAFGIPIAELQRSITISEVVKERREPTLEGAIVSELRLQRSMKEVSHD